MIITNNLNDFPASELQTYDIKAQTLDEFIQHLIDLYLGEGSTGGRRSPKSSQVSTEDGQEYLALLKRVREL